MKRKAAVLAAFLGLTGSASAQTVKDVRSVLEASLQAMGGANLKTIQYSGSGWSSRIGQTYGLAEDWPRYEGDGSAGDRREPKTRRWRLAARRRDTTASWLNSRTSLLSWRRRRTKSGRLLSSRKQAGWPPISRSNTWSILTIISIMPAVCGRIFPK